MAQQPKDEKTYFFDSPRRVRRLLLVFYGSLVLLIALDAVIHKHSYFPWEDWFGFYAVYGFVACVLLVLIAKYLLRPLVKRKEDYYER
jgi:membrane protein YdbS with pleckstrin-like domain